MSLTKSATRRLSLLAGSSLVAAGALSAASLLLAPAQAMAAVNPCGVDPAANGTAPDSILCPVATYGTGIQHTAVGDIAVTVQTGSNFGTGGVVTTAGAAGDPDDVTVTQTGGQMTLNSQAMPIFIDAATQTGDMTVTTSAQIITSNAATTGGIRAISNAGGDVTVNLHGHFATSGNVNAVGVEARSLGGNGDVTITNDPTRAITGRLYGVLASTAGAGAVTIDVSQMTATPGGVAAVRVIAGTGPVVINGAANGANSGLSAASNYGLHAVTGGTLSYTGVAVGANTAAFIDADGNATFTGRAIGGVYGIDMVTAAGTTNTINLTPTTSISSASTEGGVAAIRLQGSGNVAVNVAGELRGGVDASGLSTRPTIDILSGGIWSFPTSATVSSSTGVTATIAEGGLVWVGTETSAPTDPAVTATFSGPDDIFDNRGLIAVNMTTSQLGGPEFSPLAGETVFAGVENFRNSGTIAFGQHRVYSILYFTDDVADDILTFQDTNYIGEGGRVVLDVDLTGPSQSGCSTALRNTTTGKLPAADCIRVIDGSTSGVTNVLINQMFPFDRGAFIEDGIVLVDLDNSTSAQGHFVIDPSSQDYSSEQGGGLDKGVFFYTIAYDEAETQQKLVSMFSGNALQFPVLATAAQSLWRTSTGTWLDRQADLRGSLEQGLGGGVWLRASTEFSERDLLQSSTAAGQTFSFDNTHTQNSYAITGGIDLLASASGDNAFVLGVMAGYAHSDVEYEVSPNTAEFNGWTGGVYGSFISGGFFVDGTVNANKLVMDNDAPAFNFFPAGTVLSTDLLSLGAHVDTGWRFPIATSAFIEPLASFSYVKVFYDDVEILSDDTEREGSTVEYQDPSSMRAGVGARLGLDQQYAGFRAQYSFLARTWEETGDGNGVMVHSGTQALPITDEFSGRFNEFAVGTSLYSPGGAVSGFAKFGGKFADDYQAQNVSAGVRVNW